MPLPYKITIIGTGYVGLVTGLCLASKGNLVTCIDNDPNKIKLLQGGKSPIFENGIDDLLAECIDSGKISFGMDLQSAVEAADIVFLCLPTPENEDGTADLSYVLGVANTIAKYAKIEGKIIVNKSTVPVGTCQLVQEIFESQYRKVCVISNPEFLREGRAIEDFMRPERVVIGSDDQDAFGVMKNLYSPFVDNLDQIVCMDAKSSELTKYVANSFLATKISFVNETANLCEKLGANISDVVRGVGSDSRIGSQFLKASVGWGGSCFPKDVIALSSSSRQVGYHFEILDTVMKVNQKQKDLFIQKIQGVTQKLGLTQPTVAVWGLAFKADTDDIRKSPALEIVQCLLESGYYIRAYDPQAMPNVKRQISNPNFAMVGSVDECLDGADFLVVLTEWEEFARFDLSVIKSKIKYPVVVDGRNLFDPQAMSNVGLEYISIGR